MSKKDKNRIDEKASFDIRPVLIKMIEGAFGKSGNPKLIRDILINIKEPVRKAYEDNGYGVLNLEGEESVEKKENEPWIVYIEYKDGYTKAIKKNSLRAAKMYQNKNIDRILQDENVMGMGYMKYSQWKKEKAPYAKLFEENNNKGLDLGSSWAKDTDNLKDFIWSIDKMPEDLAYVNINIGLTDSSSEYKKIEGPINKQKKAQIIKIAKYMTNKFKEMDNPVTKYKIYKDIGKTPSGEAFRNNGKDAAYISFRTHSGEALQKAFDDGKFGSLD